MSHSLAPLSLKIAHQTDAQHLKISAGADRSRQKWELRMQGSQVLEARGSWEKRKDMGGSVFYSCTSEEGLPQPFRCTRLASSMGQNQI